MTETTEVAEKTIERYLELNAQLAISDINGKIDFSVDAQAAHEYFVNNINKKTQFFHDLEEKIKYLTEEGYYNKEIIDQYDWLFVKSLYKRAYAYRFRFKAFVGAYKFFKGYALKTYDEKNYLERYEDRVVANALHMGRGKEQLASDILDLMMKGCYQPATPTFLNAGLLDRGDLVSCYLINYADTMNDITYHNGSVGELSKRGGGVAVCLTNIRAKGDPIKRVQNKSSGVIPIAKGLEEMASYANQLGARDGAAVAWIHMCHLDALDLLDTKRENADDKVRIKTLSIGIVVPDIAYKLEAEDKDIYLFSPYDIRKQYGKEMTQVEISKIYHELVDNPKIRKKKINARRYFQIIHEIQGQSGYPFIMNEDHVNRANMIDGNIPMSNLCTEILQVMVTSKFNKDRTYKTIGKDVSCNLGSLNVYNTMHQAAQLRHIVNVATRALTTVTDLSDCECVPSIKRGNEMSHAIGLGAMDHHGFLASEHIHYDSPEAVQFTDLYFAAVNYYSIEASCDIACETKTTFEGFEKSKYYTGEYFDDYINRDWSDILPSVKSLLEKFNFYVPTSQDWLKQKHRVHDNGLYHMYRLAIAPTGSISYANNATASIGAIVDRVEARSETNLGSVYYPAPHMNNENMEYYRTAYEYGWKAQIDIYAAATKHIDQGCSMTLYMPANSTTRTLAQARIYAWKKEIKTSYYIRIFEDSETDYARQEVQICEACSV